MNRSPLQRRSPLRSLGVLKRTPIGQGNKGLKRSEIRPVSRKRAKQNRERTDALRPLREAQTWCSLCGVSGVGLDAHELLSRARGGSITDLANIVLLCRPCHDRITTGPAWAEANGWALYQYGGAA